MAPYLMSLKDDVKSCMCVCSRHFCGGDATNTPGLALG